MLDLLADMMSARVVVAFILGLGVGVVTGIWLMDRSRG